MAQFAAYIGRGLCNPRLIFPRINGPNVATTMCPRLVGALRTESFPVKHSRLSNKFCSVGREHTDRLQEERTSKHSRQGCSWQARSCLARPSRLQSLPCPSGGGLVQVRERVTIPSPQVTEQSDQGLHLVYPPSTAVWQNKEESTGYNTRGSLRLLGFPLAVREGVDKEPVRGTWRGGRRGGGGGGGGVGGGGKGCCSEVINPFTPKLKTYILPNSYRRMYNSCSENWYSPSHLSSEQGMKSQVLCNVWYYISGEAAGKIWCWSLSGMKGSANFNAIPFYVSRLTNDISIISNSEAFRYPNWSPSKTQTNYPLRKGRGCGCIGVWRVRVISLREWTNACLRVGMAVRRIPEKR